MTHRFSSVNVLLNSNELNFLILLVQFNMCSLELFHKSYGKKNAQQIRKRNLSKIVAKSARNLNYFNSIFHMLYIKSRFCNVYTGRIQINDPPTLPFLFL